MTTKEKILLTLIALLGRTEHDLYNSHTYDFSSGVRHGIADCINVVAQIEETEDG